MTGAPPRVTVVIPNWNGEPHLVECLEALREQTFRDFEVVMVDNGSRDSSVELVRVSYPEVRVVEIGRNRGFAGAVNLGIRESAAELLALLNNDTRATSSWLGELVQSADEHPEASSFASLMVQYSDAGLVNAAGDAFRLRSGAAVNRGFREPVERFREPAWVFGACAGASMYRASFFETVGLFDEQYFLVYEDVDLNMRAQRIGLACLFVPTAIVAHKLGASLGQLPTRTNLGMALRNQTLVAAKTLPLPLLTLALPAQAWQDVRATIPVRPSELRALPARLALAPLRWEARWEGLRRGLRSRGTMPRRRVSIGALVGGFDARPVRG